MSSLLNGSLVGGSFSAAVVHSISSHDADLNRPFSRSLIVCVKDKAKSKTLKPGESKHSKKNDLYFPLSHIMQDSVMSKDPNLLSLFMSLPSSKKHPHPESSTNTTNADPKNTVSESLHMNSLSEKDPASSSHDHDEKRLTDASEGARFSWFTAEKAKLLREKLKGSDNWHDTMYHSGIASRLALEARNQ